MKGSTIAAMVLAAAAASAATIFALKKAHDKKLEKACNCDDLPEGGCCFDDADEDDCDCIHLNDNEEADSSDDAPEQGCCVNGVCSLDDSADDAADQPMQIQMPENLDEADADADKA